MGSVHLDGARALYAASTRLRKKGEERVDVVGPGSERELLLDVVRDRFVRKARGPFGIAGRLDGRRKSEEILCPRLAVPQVDRLEGLVHVLGALQARHDPIDFVRHRYGSQFYPARLRQTSVVSAPRKKSRATTTLWTSSGPSAMRAERAKRYQVENGMSSL